MSEHPTDATPPEPSPDLRKHAPSPDPIDPWAAPAINAPAELTGSVPGASSPAEADQAASIWTTLDGSAPTRETTPSTFTRPSAKPLEFPGLAPQARPAPPASATPDGRPQFVLAGWGARLGAWLLDNVIVSLSVLVVTVPIGVALGMTLEESFDFLTSAKLPDGQANGAVFYALLAIQSIALPTILALMLVRWNGQTLGKRMVGLRVVRESGEPMNFVTAVRREVLGKTLLVAAAALITVGIGALLNYLWPLWDAQNRAGHDFLAKTRVVTADRP